jgi:acyl-CoA synthetase (AMP-forming)/AMP-acid ligase II
MNVPPLKGRFDTLADAFEAAAEQHGSRIAYVEDGVGRLSFAEWHQRSDALAAVLVERGVAPGDVVAIMLKASIDYAVAYGAIALAGAVVTGINARLGGREIAAILDRSAPTYAVVDHAAFSSPAAIDSVTIDIGVIDRDELATLTRADGLGAARPRRDPADPAVIVWTSGTTGIPKGAWFDHRNLEAAVHSAGVMSAPFDVRLVGTPFAHAGYMAKPWDQLAWGTSIVIAPTPWTAGDMLRLLVKERVTVAGGVPTQWAKLLEEPGIVTADLAHLRVGLVATAPAPPELIARVATVIGCPLVVRYAMTESPSISGTEPDDGPAVQYRTVGRPQVGMEVETVDAEGRAVVQGVTGRVRVRGACVMRGYWRDADMTAQVLAGDEWLMSSDLGYFDSDGNLVIVGRADDMYIRGGYNVYPLEVENVLAEHPAVERVAVVGLSIPVIGEIGVAFVVPADPSAPPALVDLRAWVSRRLADYKAPDRLVIVDALPLTPMMKVDKALLGAQAALTVDNRKIDPMTDGREVSTVDEGTRE